MEPTHELRLNKSVHTEETVQAALAAQVKEHHLEGLDVQIADTDEEYVFQWEKQKSESCGCHGH